MFGLVNGFCDQKPEQSELNRPSVCTRFCLYKVTTMSTSGEEMSDGSLLQLQTEETIEKFFKKNKTWSLLKFLNFRAENDDFTCNRRKEHGLYKKALNVLTVNNAQARDLLSGFKVKYMLVVTG
ncbi:hypothetical protein RclHR1_01670027 [Rhizophagus clarus]|uniref:Uncharacterized protein n=1 Tax=Rhizophagus clarus TaxID=94130 RepID=A0A2Z6RAY5_9GLOM|nr:hypothetical protein RclHR1_01670027 [Rhizophagus clarus]